MSNPDPRATPYDYCGSDGPVLHPMHREGEPEQIAAASHEPEPANAPPPTTATEEAKKELTIIWNHEKREISQRLNALEHKVHLLETALRQPDNERTP